MVKTGNGKSLDRLALLLSHSWQAPNHGRWYDSHNFKAGVVSAVFPTSNSLVAATPPQMLFMQR